MASDAAEFRVGDTLEVDTWGRLSVSEIARHGIDVLAGMVTSYHANCTSPYHFWCAPPDMRVFAMAELYQAGNPQGEHYIGCYLRGADFDDDGLPTIHRSPSLKMVMQLLDDGRVFVHLGPLADSGTESTADGMGLLNQQAAQRFVVIPRPVPNVPAVPDGPVTFVLQRLENLWYVAHFPHSDTPVGSSRIQLFATMTVGPQPTQFAEVKINNFPA